MGANPLDTSIEPFPGFDKGGATKLMGITPTVLQKSASRTRSFSRRRRTEPSTDALLSVSRSQSSTNAGVCLFTEYGGRGPQRMICLCMSASICMAIWQISLRATVVWLKGLNQTKDAQLEGVIRKARKGREVLISLH